MADFTAPEVKQRCLVLVNFNHCKDKNLVWCDHHEYGPSLIRYIMLVQEKKSPFTVNPTCVNLSIRVSRLSYYPWDPRLDNLSRHPLWLGCQLFLRLLLLLLPPYLPLLMHTPSVNLFLPYCRHHPTIKYSSLHLHLHHTNTCTNYTRSVMKINRAMWSLIYESTVEKYFKLLMYAIIWWFWFIRNSFLRELLRCYVSAVLDLSRSWISRIAEYICYRSSQRLEH